MNWPTIKTDNKLLRVTTVVLVIINLLLPGCGGGGDPAPERSEQDEIKTILTSGIWKIQSVSVDGLDKTSMYNNLTLVFSSTGYSAGNGLPVWPISGTWTFGNEGATIINRNDGLEISIQEATNTSLKLGLTWDQATLGSGRTSSIAGKHVFNFSK